MSKSALTLRRESQNCFHLRRSRRPSQRSQGEIRTSERQSSEREPIMIRGRKPAQHHLHLACVPERSLWGLYVRVGQSVLQAYRGEKYRRKSKIRWSAVDCGAHRPRKKRAALCGRSRAKLSPMGKGTMTHNLALGPLEPSGAQSAPWSGTVGSDAYPSAAKIHPAL